MSVGGPQLRVDPIEVAPGHATIGSFTLHNPGPSPVTWSVRVIGLDPRWVQTPERIGPVPPGATAAGDLVVTLPLGHPPSDLVGKLEAMAVDRPAGSAAEIVSADLVISVGDGSQIAAAMEPPTVTGRGTARFDLVLRNRGRTPLRVELAATSPDRHVKVRFSDPAPVLPPGVEVRIPSRVKGPRPVGGSIRRHPFGIRVQGRTTPLNLEGTLLQRPFFRAWFTKAVAIGLVVAVWVAVAIVGISALSGRLAKSANNKAIVSSPLSVPAAPSAGAGVASGAAGVGKAAGGAASTGVTPPAAPSGASGAPAPSKAPAGSPLAGSALAGASGGGVGAEAAGPATPASGPSAPGSTSPSGSSGAAAGSNGASQTSRVSGQVAAADPGGVTVTIAPTSLVDEAAQGANFANSGAGVAATQTAARSKAGGSTPIGKLYGTLVSATTASGTTATESPSMTTKTTPDGSWAFSGLRSPGYYLVTFAKAGYTTSRYIVTTTADGQPVKLSAAIGPGKGALSGTVFGPSGPLGGVDLTITDGTITIHTKTPTVGAVGTWAVTGLSTPDTYLVSATAAGYGTQTAIATLPAGGSQKGINQTMTPGTGSLSGIVTSVRNGAGVGGLTVTASDGTTSLTATTTTTNPVGSYILPNLDIPGTYALTISGPGWVSQTQQVDLAGNAVVNSSVTPASADVTGVVTDAQGAGLPDAGVVLTNDTNTYKTLTQSASPVGGFDFGQVPPGQYILTVTDYGYQTQSTAVTVVAGQAKSVNVSMPVGTNLSINTGTIQGTVTDLFNQKPVQGANLTLDGVATGQVSASNGNYQITGVGPGVHVVSVSAADALKIGFEPASVQVTVPLGATVFAPTLLLPILDKVAGVVLDGATHQPVADPVVTLVDSTTGQPAGVAATTPSFPTTLVPAPSQGGFEVDNLPHGNYTMTVSAPTVGNVSYQKTEIPVTLALDTNQLFVGSQALTLDEAPAYHVVTLLAAGVAPPAYQAGVTVTLTNTKPADGSPPPGTSPSTGEELTVGPLVAGDTYTVSYTYTSGATTYSSPSVQFKAEPNNLAVDTALLYQQISTDTNVTLSFPYRTPSGTLQCPVSTTASTGALAPCPTVPLLNLPTVLISGATGYAYVSPGVPGAPQTATVAATTTGDGTWLLSAAQANPFVSGQATVTIANPSGVSTFVGTTSPITLGAATPLALTLDPVPSAITGTITPSSGVTVSVTPSTSNGVSITAADVAGALQFSDGSSAQTGAAEPGVYDLAYSAAGYDPASAVLTVGLCLPSACSTTVTPSPTQPVPPAVNLVAHVALTVNLSAALAPPVGAATAYLCTVSGGTGPAACGGGSSNLVSSTTLSGTSVTFSDLSVTASGLNNVEVFIRAAGYRTYASGPLALVASQPALTDSVVEEGWITGHVTSMIGSTPGAANKVTVTAVDKATTPGCAETNPPAVVTDGNGNYTIVGDTSPGATDGGLCVGTSDVYQVSVTPPTGYTASTAVFVPAATPPYLQPGANGAADLTVTAVKQTVTITIAGSDGKPVPGVILSALSSTGTTVTQNGPSTCTADPGSNCDTMTVTIDPVPYTFNFSAPGYSPLSVGPVPFSPGVAPKPFTVTLNLQQNTILGVVNTQGPLSLTGLNGATVTLYKADGTTKLATATTAHDSVYGDGFYRFDSSSVAGQSPDYIPSGSYVVTVALSGYSFSAPLAFATSYPTTTENLTMTVNPVAVSVPVANTLSLDLSGATATLTPDTAAPTATCSGVTLVRGLGRSQSVQVSGTSASFTSVVPDAYQLLVSGTVAAGTLPTQTAVPIVICPAGTTRPNTFTVQVGQINGTVTITPASTTSLASGAVVSISGGSPALANPTVACSNTGCSTGSYSVLAALGTSYTVHAVLTGSGYTAPDVTADPTSSSPTATASSAFTPITHSVTVTASSIANSSMTLINAVVTLVNAQHTYTGTAGTAITGVVPDNTDAYNVTVTLDGVTVTGKILVPIADSGPSPLNLTSAFAPVSGTIAPSPALTSGTAATVTIAGTALPVTAAGGVGTFGPYYEPAGAYTMAFGVNGLTTQSATVTVADGTPLVEDATAVVVPVQDSTGSPASGLTATITTTAGAWSDNTAKTTGDAIILVPSAAGAAVAFNGTVTGTLKGKTVNGTFSGSVTPGTVLTVPAVTAQ
ncbi:carboxypeptidase regulatory-like domain-containing protein [Acidiferrimicrobium sp. IK]|uniref:carboxypeptidase regulatory-like domain-containing protein n=1 Tax=Acidiferrimicrobium sp. IK TaxID=2871700 RepID=UPI0021CB6BB0|nr:carboxypeptidase regulatory-like domain-containing protein [Acidiferrimicrobium sp. IK]MCU4186053.1 carboxypeptidase regulatory-like domain-containing protein [Acidiferrimicrobium sp. IK]